MAQIKLIEGQNVKVDNKYFDYLNQWNWHRSKTYNTSYARRNKGNKVIYMHRAIVELELLSKQLETQYYFFHISPKKYEVDHIDGNGLNNEILNLKIVSHRENLLNIHKNKTSKYPGVAWNKCAKKWEVKIRIEEKRYFLGYFKNETKAYETYLKAFNLITNGEIKNFLKIFKRKKSSKYKGVSWSKKYKKWRAYTTINKKFKHLGYFEDEEEAYNVVKGFVENGM